MLESDDPHRGQLPLGAPRYELGAGRDHIPRGISPATYEG